MDLQPAVDFMKKTGKELCCGEFGIYDKTSVKSRTLWFSDLINFLNEFEIGHGALSYKDPGFGFVKSSTFEVIDNDLVKIISR